MSTSAAAHAYFHECALLPWMLSGISLLALCVATVNSASGREIERPKTAVFPLHLFTNDRTEGGTFKEPVDRLTCVGDVVNLRFYPDYAVTQNALHELKATLQRQGLPENVLERTLDKTKFNGLDELASLVVDKVSALCPNVSVIHIAQLPAPERTDGLLACSRASRGWKWEYGTCDARGDRARMRFTEFVWGELFQHEASVQGWLGLQSKLEQSAMTALEAGGQARLFTNSDPSHSRNQRSETEILAGKGMTASEVMERSKILLSRERYQEVLDGLIPSTRNGVVREGALAQALGMMGVAYDGLGQTQEAMIALRQAIDLERYDSLGEPFFLKSILDLGTLYERSGRFEAAYSIYRRGNAWADRKIAAPGSPPITFEWKRDILIRIALLLEKGARSNPDRSDAYLDSADKSYEEALATTYRETSAVTGAPMPAPLLREFESGSLPEYSYAALTATAWARFELARGNLKKAVLLARPAAKELARAQMENPFGAQLAVVLAVASRDLTALGRAGASVARMFGPDHPTMAWVLTESSRLQLASGMTADGVQTARAAVKIVLDRADRLSDDRGLDTQAELAEGREAVEVLLKALTIQARERPELAAALEEESFAIAQMSQRTAAGQAMLGTVARLAVGKGEVGELLRKRQDIVRRWQSLDRKALETGLSPDETNGTAVGPARERPVKQLLNAISMLDADIEARGGDLSRLLRPHNLTVKDVRALLRPDECVVTFFVGRDRSYVWAINGTRTSWKELPLAESEVVELIGQVRRGLDRSPLDPVSYDLDAAYDLHEALLGQVSDVLAGR